MEIRNNPAGSTPPPMQTDITRPVREGIEQRTDKVNEDTPNLRSIKKRAKNFRLKIKEELFADMVRKRGKNYRQSIKPDKAPPASGTDTVEFSDAARALNEPAEHVTTRAQRLADLKARYEERRLASDELISRAAARMLSND